MAVLFTALNNARKSFRNLIAVTTLLPFSPFVVIDARKFLKMGVWRSFLRVLLILHHVEFILPVPPRTLFQDVRYGGRLSWLPCVRSEWVDNSSLAVLPVPVVAFFAPHFDLHKVNNEPYLNRCGASTRVANRGVSVDKTACIPAELTRIVTLGVLQ